MCAEVLQSASLPNVMTLRRVIEALMEFARAAGCYKVILDCGESNVAFYEKCGLTRKEVQMVDLPITGTPMHDELCAMRGALHHRSAERLPEAWSLCRCLREKMPAECILRFR